MSEVVHVFTAGLGLQKLDSSLLEVLQQNNIIFADLIVHFSLEVVVRLQMTRTHPVGLAFYFVRHQPYQLDRLSSAIA